ncbi:MAG TPA: hypothetical protein VM692_04360 [Gammaproteobacteria bacterium]|nr:hypothetical protein [Gammaproteobacteria bacterium]
MSAQSFTPTAYVKDGCPFSFKFLTFAAETGLLGDLNIVRVRDGDANADTTKQMLSEKLGKPATFPTVEIEPGRYMTDSDKLIEHYAHRADVSPDELQLLSFYKQTILPKLFEHYKLTSGAKSAAKN